jgi:hypothetical protein
MVWTTMYGYHGTLYYVWMDRWAPSISGPDQYLTILDANTNALSPTQMVGQLILKLCYGLQKRHYNPTCREL